MKSRYEVSIYHYESGAGRRIANFNLPDHFEEEDAVDMINDMSRRLGKNHAVLMSEETNAAGDYV